MSTLIRVVNQQLVARSLLIDKVDRSQGNFEGYAQLAKQAVYVPYSKTTDAVVKGYIDMVPTDEVLLSLDSGTLKKLAAGGYITTTAFNSTLIATPVVSGATWNGVSTALEITGTTFTSLAPDTSKVIITDAAGTSTQTLTDAAIVAGASPSAFGATSIIIDNTLITIGTPTTNWTVKVIANGKTSNTFTLV